MDNPKPTPSINDFTPGDLVSINGDNDGKID